MSVNTERCKHGHTRKTHPNCFKHQSSANILLFDIETAPIRAYVWSATPDYIPPDMIASDWFIICWSAKWLFEKEIYNGVLTPGEARSGNDKRIVKALWKFFDAADILIAHNLMKFDRKKANTRFLKYGLNSPTPYECIDTLIHARKQFTLPSNKLDYLARRFFQVDGKKQTNFKLWSDCMGGNKKALNEMQEYCDQDVRVLEDVYLYMRSWIKPHPNIGLHITETKEACPTCGSTQLSWEGFYRTYVNEYQSFRCKECGAIGRSRHKSTPKLVSERLTVSASK